MFDAPIADDRLSSRRGYRMTKADLVERVTAQISRTAGPMISKKDCARVVDAFLDAVKDALKEQHNIEVRGFSTFKIRRRKTRMALSPRSLGRFGSGSRDAGGGGAILEGRFRLDFGGDPSSSVLTPVRLPKCL